MNPFIRFLLSDLWLFGAFQSKGLSKKFQGFPVKSIYFRATILCQQENGHEVNREPPS